jgi:transcription-repair coupling factor (superfamily II helicase)
MVQWLIVGVHPRLLEKPAVWFKKQTTAILRARHLNTFWHNHTLVVETGKHIKLSECSRALTELGYVRLHGEGPVQKGAYIQRGGALVLHAINHKTPFRIEFIGNAIEHIEEDAGAKTAEEHTEFLSANNLPSLRPNDYVVHVDHGIGVYRGIEAHDGKRFLIIAYAKNDMLFVPEYQTQRVSPYIGFRTPVIHRLGADVWTRAKKKAREDIVAFAKQLLAVYASREVASRTAYEEEPEMEHELARSFPFEETPGQLRALNEIYADMRRQKPMDRLLSADVGFGKTEVALRAAFRALCNQRQVALLAPTTILAEQHYETFRERLQRMPVSVTRLTRICSAQQQKETLQRIKNGKADIVIGTHRLLSKDVIFHNLGLLILDEEQRFGVKQKELLKEKKRSVDILSLSATPIPRTMHLALAHIRPMSIIETPPPLRIAPKTFVLPFHKRTIQQAVSAEIARGGQVYALSNHIRKLPLARELIQSVVPAARIGILHGRMPEAEIIRAMRNFRAKKINVLLATTIIENGLDIENANTLIVEDATRIGLSQAHQLRGRIGRSNTQAYAYFLYPARALTGKAADRLDALLRTQHLGAGHELALRDMEIRGAGNILGRDQSGRANQVGLNLYCQMLAEAVEHARQNKPSPRHTQTGKSPY